MVNVRNIKRDNPFLEIELRKSGGNFSSLGIFHDHNHLGPGKLLFGKRPLIEKPGRLGLEPASENLFGSLAPVEVLVANKQHFHGKTNYISDNINFPKILPILALILIISSYGAAAAGISISPSAVQFEIYRGETAKAKITITNPSAEPLDFRLAPEDNPEWFSFSDDEGTLSAGESKEITIKAMPPMDVSNGEYTSFITAYLEPAEPGSELSLNIAAAIKTKLIISGKQKIGLSVDGITADSAEQGLPIILSAELSNTGNVRLSPSAEITIKKNTRTIKKVSSALPELLPGSTSKAMINLSSQGLEPSNYTASARILIGSKKMAEQSLDITIYPYGTFTRVGEFLELSLGKTPELGMTAKHIARFRSTGSIPLRAKLKSELYLGNSLVQVVESDEMLVMPGETAELAAYFTPPKPGSYTLISKIAFEGKESEQKTLSFSVSPTSSVSFNGILISAAIVLMGLMLFYGKEVWKMVGKKIEGKVYYCIDCNRPIKHKGRCMLCNITARKRLDAQDHKYAD
jgi:hypothetical protein